MVRNVPRVLLATLLVAAAGCHDATAPGALALGLSATTRAASVNEDTVSVQTDSAIVSLSGTGAGAARWSATHGSAGWITLLTASGTGPGVLRWQRDPTGLQPGTYVDTIVVTVDSALGSPARILDSLTIRMAQAQFITAKRAWLPGERDALIAQIIRDRSFVFPYVGDVSDLAPAFFSDPDSVVVIVRNPAYPGSVGSAAFRAPGVAELTMPPAFDSTWIILGQDIRIIDTTQVPADTSDWLGTFWAKKLEETWKGIVLAYRCTNRTGGALTSCKTNRTATTGGNIAVSTTSFDASGAKSGAGGGERRFTTLEYWEASSGSFLVSAAAYGADATVTSGPYTGGTQASGSMQGRLLNIVMPRLLPTQDGSSITVNLDFRLTAISAIKLTCVFSNPCTGQAGSAVARRAWGGSFREHLGISHRPVAGSR